MMTYLLGSQSVKPNKTNHKKLKEITESLLTQTLLAGTKVYNVTKGSPYQPRFAKYK